MRKILPPVIAVIAVLAVALGFRLWLLNPDTPGPARIGGPFTLSDAQGRPVTDAEFRGRLMLVYFGYTFCPDVCPTSLGAVGEALRQLGPDAAKVAPLFITVDPQRDGPAEVGAYAANFHPAMIGLTGTPEQVKAVAQAYKVYYAKVPVEGAKDDPMAYTMDHSSILYLMDRDGRFLTHFAHGAPPDQIAAGIRKYL